MKWPFPLFFLYQTYIEQGGKPEMIKFRDLVKTLKMGDKKSSSTPVCMMPTR